MSGVPLSKIGAVVLTRGARTDLPLRHDVRVRYLPAPGPCPFGDAVTQERLHEPLRLGQAAAHGSRRGKYALPEPRVADVESVALDPLAVVRRQPGERIGLADQLAQLGEKAFQGIGCSLEATANLYGQPFARALDSLEERGTGHDERIHERRLLVVRQRVVRDEITARQGDKGVSRCLVHEVELGGITDTARSRNGRGAQGVVPRIAKKNLARPMPKAGVALLLVGPVADLD